MNLLEYWQISEKPFEDLTNPRFFYQSRDHTEALDRMLYMVRDRNMKIGLLTGEIGSGKTLTRTVFERSLSRHEYEIVSLDSSGLAFNDLLYDIARRISFQHIAFEMGGLKIEDRRNDKFYLLETFQRQLSHLNETEHRHAVVILDEAQQLAAGVLDEFKNLTNLGTDTRNYLTLLLIGQPELRENVRGLPQVDQRVSLRFHLNNLDLEDTRKYIQHRLRIAGCPHEDIFTDTAISTLYRETAGVPREINRLCKLALDYGAGASLKEIDEATVRLIADDIRKHR